ncbi:V-type proton ATPase subunit F 1 isoform X4 [Drosophila montana]|uniref:V-type proton ATPase subunit F 1 isoform X4 n=1 Tax=Drosophila montana TaxID=40370 RepID=UPI00313C94EF
MALHSAIKGKLISVIGDEDTCVGFLLGGVGEINKNRHPNFMVVDKSKHRATQIGTLRVPWSLPLD